MPRADEVAWGGLAGQRELRTRGADGEVRMGVERYGLTQALVSLLSRQPGTSPQALL